MKGMINKKQVIEKARVVNIKATVRSLAHQHQTSINKTSLRLDFSESYLNKVLKKKDHHISLVVALSIHFQHNLLEYYFQLLPAPIQVTKREKELTTQLVALQKQLDDVTKERDFLKEVVMKR